MAFLIQSQVEDNKDPEYKGRIKVSLGKAMPGVECVWLPIIRAKAEEGSGFWHLPEAGAQVIAAITNKETLEGYVLGCIYDENHLPPKRSAEKAADSTVLASKKHRIEIIDKENQEEIRIESAEGKMRARITKEGGIKIINGLGDINIKCRSIKTEAEEGININAGKKANAESVGKTEAETSGKITIESGKEVKIKGKNVKLNGTRGVTAEGKQIAKSGDKVMGFDIHQTEVPSNSGTQIVPLPHPFIGELKDKLSGNVKIGNQNCATKGSIAKHTSSSHMQLPGTIKFAQSPKNEGEVSSGTSKKVKINGKEAAVIGSAVTTCNDIGAKDNSTIITAGATMPMPKIINPINTEEWNKKQKEAKKKNPEITKVKWAKSKAEEGEEVELIAETNGIEDGNMLTLQVFPEGKGPEDGAAYAKYPLTIKDGAASAKWSYQADIKEKPAKGNPRFIFTAHSAWCRWKKSENALEVELKRPEITKAKWKDAEGKETGSGKAGETLKLYAETKDMEEGQGVTFHIFDEHKKEVFGKSAKVKNGNAEIEWNAIDIRKNEDRKELKYIFKVSGNRCKTIESREVQIKNPQIIKMEWNKKAIYYGEKATLKIETFELSDEKPSCKLQLRKKDYTTEDALILEKDITIDNDKVEIEIEFNFKLPINPELELIIIPMLFFKGKILKSNNKDTNSGILLGIGTLSKEELK